MLLVETSGLRAAKVPELDFRDALLLDIACALAIHAIYKRHEPDTSQPLVQLLLLVIVPSIPATCFIPHFQDYPILAFVVAFSVFYVCLVASIILYRLSPWHPLARYPGPTIAKMSKIWTSYVMAKGKHHIYIKKLHEKYGPYIRIGPNEISILDVSAIPGIMSSDGMPKGPMWTARMPKDGAPALIALRSMREHARRRRPWNRAFSTAAIKNYEPIVQKRALQLIGELEKQSIKSGITSVILTDWFSYFSTDFMGDMAFGGGFELMRDGGDKEGVWTIIESGARIAAIFQHLPWMMPLLRKFPGVNKKVRRLREFGDERAQARKLHGSLAKDLFYHLIDEEHVDNVPLTDKEIVSDGELAIVAGSDTTSTTLSRIFYYLLRNPWAYKRLQQEIDEVFPPGEGDPFDTSKLAEMAFLNAVINETLRLQPPVPTYLQRGPEAGTGGKWVGDHFILEGTSLIVPPYALGRNPAYFSPAPDIFWPERWLRDKIGAAPRSSPPGRDIKSDSEVITNPAAFIPFSYGPWNCAGRVLALTEMRMVVALVMQRFELQFAPDYNANDWEEHLEDFFIMCNGALRVTVTPRM